MTRTASRRARSGRPSAIGRPRPPTSSRSSTARSEGVGPAPSRRRRSLKPYPRGAGPGCGRHPLARRRRRASPMRGAVWLMRLRYPVGGTAASAAGRLPAGGDDCRAPAGVRGGRAADGVRGHRRGRPPPLPFDLVRRPRRSGPGRLRRRGRCSTSSCTGTTSTTGAGPARRSSRTASSTSPGGSPWSAGCSSTPTCNAATPSASGPGGPACCWASAGSSCTTALVQHKLFGLHQIRYGVELLPHDLTWNVLAVVAIVAGLVVLRRA